MHRDLEDSELVSRTRYRGQSPSYSRQSQYFGRPPIQIGQTYQYRMGIGSNHSKLHISNAQLSKCGLVFDTIQSQASIVCSPSSRQSCASSRRTFNELEFTSHICVSSYNSDILYSSQDMSISVQNSSHCSFLAPTAEVLRVTSTSGVSPYSSSTISKTSDTVKRKISTPKPPITRPKPPLIYQSKKFSKDVASFVSKTRRKSTQKVYDAKWIIFSNWCHRRKIDPVSDPLTIIANFIIYFFSEKNDQISTIKGYRAMISNTLKFKTGNRIRSNPVLSELIRSFELQHPVQRSLTPK